MHPVHPQVGRPCTHCCLGGSKKCTCCCCFFVICILLQTFENKRPEKKHARNSHFPFFARYYLAFSFYKLKVLGRNHDGVITRRGIVSHHPREEKPRESFPWYSLTHSLGMKPRLCGNISLSSGNLLTHLKLY